MTPFLRYELLTPEDADPVIIRITSQRERGFPDFRASNGVMIFSLCGVGYYHYSSGGKHLVVRGSFFARDFCPIEIPLADWPLVKAAIAELNEHYKEKDMKEEKVKFYVAWESENSALKNCEGYQPPTWYVRDFDNLADASVYYWQHRERGIDSAKLFKGIEGEAVKEVWQEAQPEPKKPKVKVEYRKWNFCEEAHDFGKEYGVFHLVQFWVTGWNGTVYYDNKTLDFLNVSCGAKRTELRRFSGCRDELVIGFDARDKWSHPLLLPEEIYKKLPEICRALEDRANGGKG